MLNIAPAAPQTRPRLRAMMPEELCAFVATGGFEAYRGKQVFHWLHARGARSLEEMKNVPRAMREWLAANADLGGIARVAAERTSADGSTKFLFEFSDGRRIESVLMPDHGRQHYTLCMSSQVGCAVDCKFCLTGRGGFFRNMTADEIADQAIYARRFLGEGRTGVPPVADDAKPTGGTPVLPSPPLRNLVYMGMGEPLLNTAEVIRSIKLLTHQNGADFSPRRMTVSTSGIIPGLDELGAENTNVNLAVSLNSPTQDERERLMPITKKHPLDDLLAALRRYPLRTGRRITIEYVMLAGVNDSPKHAWRVSEILRGIPCKVNLIPFNAHEMLPFTRPANEVVEAFGAVLRDADYTVSVRWSKALDVSGACGNLATEFRRKRTAPDEMPADLEFFALAGRPLDALELADAEDEQ